MLRYIPPKLFHIYLIVSFTIYSDIVLKSVVYKTKNSSNLPYIHQINVKFLSQIRLFSILGIITINLAYIQLDIDCNNYNIFEVI
jgi:hypothetical protein